MSLCPTTLMFVSAGVVTPQTGKLINKDFIFFRYILFSSLNLYLSSLPMSTYMLSQPIYSIYGNYSSALYKVTDRTLLSSSYVYNTQAQISENVSAPHKVLVAMTVRPDGMQSVCLYLYVWAKKTNVDDDFAYVLSSVVLNSAPLPGFRTEQPEIRWWKLSSYFPAKSFCFLRTLIQSDLRMLNPRDQTTTFRFRK